MIFGPFLLIVVTIDGSSRRYIRVFPVVGNWPMYLVALAAGSVITMFMLALLKKPVYKEN